VVWRLLAAVCLHTRLVVPCIARSLSSKQYQCKLDELFLSEQTLAKAIDVKNVFYVFIPVTLFTFLTFFYFVNVFILKNAHWKFNHDVREALLKPQKWFNRPRLYYESGWVRSADCGTLGSAYSDTTVVTSCSRHSQYVKSWIVTKWKIPLCLYSSSCKLTAPLYSIRHRIRQEVEQIRVTFFIQRYSTFLNVFHFVHVFLRFLTFF